MTSSGFDAAGFQEDYINVAGPAAQVVMAQFGVPASVGAAQSIIESNWGRSRLSTADKNYFGFKCTAPDQPGPIAIGCRKYQTEECTPNCHPVDAYFRVYSSMTDSFRDYGRLLTTNPVYAPAFQHKDNPDEFARLIGRRYATDPEYANKVIQLMRNWNLYRFNTGVGGDVNGDGKADIVAVVGDKLRYYYGTGDGGFHFHSEGGVGWDVLTQVDLGDVNADGKADIIGVVGDKLRYYYGTGDGNFHFHSEGGVGWGALSKLAVADVNADRKADIIGVVGDKLRYYYGTGDGNFHFHSDSGAGWDALAQMSLGDVNADGKADIIAVVGDKLRYYYGTGDANFHFHSEGGASWGALSKLAVADVNADRKADIIGVVGDKLRYYYGTGDGNFHYHSEGGAGWDTLSKLAAA
nr:Flagellar protein FlgJ [peptidoglycan hydrolase] (EC 3.2.1.-) [Kibdelosporangium sp. MJ126-NF4]